MTLQSKIESVLLSKIFVDSRIQRPLDEYRVRKLEKEFSLDGVGVLCLSNREDGYACLDGQHRIAAMKKLGLTDVKLKAEVFYNLSLAEEAGIFIQRNNTQKVKYHDKFLVRLIEGDELANAMLRLINSHGWRIVGQEDLEGPTFLSLESLERIMKRSPELAERTLSVVDPLWGVAGTDYRITRGVAAFLARYDDQIDDTRLIQKVSETYATPGPLIDAAQTLSNAYKSAVYLSVADLLVVEYNRDRWKTKRLAPWRSEAN